MLKPCPFCGKDVYMEKRPMWRLEGSTIRGYSNSYEFVIECTNPECGCNVKLGKNSTINATEEEARDEAIKHWNQRASGITITDPVINQTRPIYPNPSPWTIATYAAPEYPSPISTNGDLTIK